MNGSAANPHAPNPPAVSIPETLPLPDATAIVIVGDISAAAVAVSRSVISRAVIIAGTSQRAADNGAADNTSRQTGTPSALRLGRGGGQNAQGGDGSECHQCFSHGFHLSYGSNPVSAKVPYFA